MAQLKVLITMIFLCLGVSNVFAAYTEEELKAIMEQRIQHKVAQMNDNISFMADKSKSLETRNYYREMALNLFIEKGEPFEDLDGIRNSGVKMETTSIYRKKPTRRLMKNYFTGLINLRYSKVDVQSTEAHNIKVGDLQKIDDDGNYVATAYFEQIFVAYMDGRIVYKDKTKKMVKVYVFAEETIDGIEYIVRLGDVTAIETKPL